MPNNPTTNWVRSFIGIPLLPTDVAWCENLVAAVRSRCKHSDKLSELRWVPSENLHITLAFLGTQPEQTLIELSENLSSLLQHRSGFLLPIFRLSSFPDAKSRILALELNASPALMALQQQVVGAVLDAGIQLSQSHGRFRPHITLARVRSGTAPLTYEQPLEQTLAVQSVVLFESCHGAQGVFYRARARFELG